MTDLGAATADRVIRYARVIPANELRDGELIPVEINGRPVVLVRHAGDFYAVQNNCSHKDFPLSEAGFDPRDEVLVCAWHGGCFDLRTGAAARSVMGRATGAGRTPAGAARSCPRSTSATPPVRALSP